MNQILVSTLIFISGLIVGFFVGKKTDFVGTIFNAEESKPTTSTDSLKVLHKAEPTTYQQKVADALDKDKPVIKIFRK